MQSSARNCLRRLLSAAGAGVGPSSQAAGALLPGACRQLHSANSGAGALKSAAGNAGVAEELRGMRFQGAQLFRGFAGTTHSVLVENNNVDRAFKRLKRKMIDSGFLKEMKARVFHQKPSQLGIQERKEHETRVRSKRLKFKLKWIMRKKNRGF